MAGKISGVIMAFSFVFALINGRMEQVAAAAVEGCGKAVTLTLSLLGLMCLWCGIMRVAEAVVLLHKISKLMSPFLRVVFPDSWKKGIGINEISAAITANILGIGNAATPLAVSAMKALAADNNSDFATDDMVTFTVLGTAFPSLIPTTVIALRSAAGSVNPFEIVVPVWICSLLLSAFAILMSRGLRFFKKEKNTRGQDARLF